MRIAIAKEGNVVSGHFGHCKGFEIVDVVDGEIDSRNFIENPGHRPGFLPPFLAEKGVNVIISGGMGETAQQLFQENNISVLVGASGPIDQVIQSYMEGTLKSSEHVCDEHMHHEHCND